MRRYLGGLILSAALFAPGMALLTPAVNAQDQRYYDRDHKDYHEWNDGERRAYRHWVEEERHEKYRDWNKISRERQREYWRWRHDHPDWH